MKKTGLLSLRMYCFALIAVILLTFVGCNSSKTGSTNPLASQPANASVQGKVSGEGDMSGIPVYLLGTEVQVPPSANIRFSASADSSGGQLYFSITDSAGVFSFTDVIPGNYNLVAKKDKNLGGIKRNIAVSAGASILPTDLELLLTATGEISGQIQVPSDFSNRSGIIAFLPGTSYAAFSDENGAFTITGVPVGNYSVLFTAPGMAKAKLDNIAVSAGLATALPLVTLAKDTSSLAGLIWKGTLAGHPAAPQTNWAYYNSTDKKAYLWDGTAWQVMAESITGPQGPAGTNGISISWKGTLSAAPANPQLNWAYYNSTDKKSYIWDGSTWQILAQDGSPFDSTAPIISEISWNADSTTSAYIKWTTNEESTSQVKWGLSSDYSMTSSEDHNYTKQHRVKITGLTAGVTYHFAVVSKDSGGNISQSSDMSSIMNYAPILIGTYGHMSEFSAILKDGFVWVFGYNNSGQLGLGTKTTQYVPTRIENLNNVVQIAANTNEMLALKNDGTVWKWGGQRSFVPTMVIGLSNIVKISTSFEHCLFLKSDGTVWASGYNQKGQLGDGTTINKLEEPVKVIGLENVMAISAGWQHSLALKSDGTIWTWGGNDYGQLGDGTLNGRLQAEELTNIPNCKDIYAGWEKSMALKTDGTVWIWGADYLGSEILPRQFTSLNNVAKIFGGPSHSFVIKNDGSAWGWGVNSFGQLGNGTYDPVNPVLTPVLVTSITDIVAFGMGLEYSLAACSDGSFYAWGTNWSGQLGVGNTDTKMAPTLIRFPDQF